MIALGLFVTKVAERAWPFTVEDSVNRGLAGDRTSFWNGVTLFFSGVGSTPAIIAMTVLVAILLRVRLHRWREPLMLCAAVSAQAIVFFFATRAIDRRRPGVPHLDDSPPTSSFPSGHTSAAMALYGDWRWSWRRSRTVPVSRPCAGRCCSSRWRWRCRGSIAACTTRATWWRP